MQTSFWNRLVSATPWILLAILAVSNVILLRQNRSMREGLRRGEPAVLQDGDRVPAFTAETLKGDPLTITYSGQGPKRLFLYFTPTCKFCVKQFPYWRNIIRQADSARIEVIGVVSELEDVAKLETFLGEMKSSRDSAAPMNVVLVPDGVLRSYKLSPTPLTLLVSNTGIVEKAWVGLWDEANVAQASSLMGVTISSD